MTINLTETVTRGTQYDERVRKANEIMVLKSLNPQALLHLLSGNTPREGQHSSNNFKQTR